MNGDFETQNRQLGKTIGEAMKAFDKQMDSPELKASMQAAVDAERSMNRRFAQIEEDRKASALEAERRGLQNESAAIATVETSEAIRAMNAALMEDRVKRDRSEKRTLIIGIAGLILMTATLLVTLLK